MVEELVEYYWSDEHGQGAMYEGLHCKVEPDLDTTATEAAWDRLLDNRVVCDNPRDEGTGMKHLTTRWEETWRKRNNEWKYKVRFVERENKVGRSSVKISLPRELHTALDALWTFSCPNVVCQPSLWITLMLFIRLLSWMTWW